MECKNCGNYLALNWGGHLLHSWPQTSIRWCDKCQVERIGDEVEPLSEKECDCEWWHKSQGHKDK